MSSLTKLRSELKVLRNEHAAKPISKMSEAEIQKELLHHQLGCKAREVKESRIAALAKARESRAKAKTEEKVDVKVPVVSKKKEPKSEPSAPAAPKKSSAPKKSEKEAEEVVEKKASRTKVIRIEDDEE